MGLEGSSLQLRKFIKRDKKDKNGCAKKFFSKSKTICNPMIYKHVFFYEQKVFNRINEVINKICVIYTFYCMVLVDTL